MTSLPGAGGGHTERESLFPPAESTHPVCEIVTWVDSASIGDGMWVARDNIDPVCLMDEGLTQKTVGFVLDETPEVLLLAQSVGPDRDGGVIAIPKRSIVDRDRQVSVDTPRRMVNGWSKESASMQMSMREAIKWLDTFKDGQATALEAFAMARSALESSEGES